MGCYPCTIKRKTNFYQQKQGYPHDYRGYPLDHIDFTDKNTKNHTLHPSILGVRDRETSFAPKIYMGAAFKGLTPPNRPLPFFPSSFNASLLTLNASLAPFNAPYRTLTPLHRP